MEKCIRLGFVLLCLMVCSSSFADEDCDASMAEAKSLYNSGQYEKAKKLFEYVQGECGTTYGGANTWVQKCNQAISEASSSKSSDSSAKSKTTTTTRLSVSNTTISAPAEGTTVSIAVNCNTSWEIEFASGTMYTATRSGNSVSVTIHANPSEQSRNDYFNVKTTDGQKKVKVSLSQTGKVSGSSSSSSGSTSTSNSSGGLSVSSTYISSSSYGRTETITVTCSKPWEVQYASGTMYSVSRSGSTLTVTIAPNNSSGNRQDFFNVKTTDGQSVVKVQLYQTGRSTSSSSSSGTSRSSYGSSYRSYNGGYREILDDWYENSGRIECSWVGIGLGIGTEFGMDLSFVNTRFWMFEIDPLAFHIGTNYSDFVFVYQPLAKVHFPINDSWSMTLATGPAIGNLYTWFDVEVGASYHLPYSCMNVDMFMRYNGWFTVGAAISFSKAWRTSY